MTIFDHNFDGQANNNNMLVYSNKVAKQENTEEPNSLLATENTFSMKKYTPYAVMSGYPLGEKSSFSLSLLTPGYCHIKLVASSFTCFGRSYCWLGYQAYDVKSLKEYVFFSRLATSLLQILWARLSFACFFHSIAKK